MEASQVKLAQVKHPAKYSQTVLAKIERFLPERGMILDPFAGVGTIHQFSDADRATVGFEIEAEWARQGWTDHGGTITCDALQMMRKQYLRGFYDCVVTSPCYGNRMADHHEAKDQSQRNTYRHVLGRPLTEGSSASLQWGPEYREFHAKAWNLVEQVLKPGGSFILNISDHIRRGERQLVTRFHCLTLFDLGFHLIEVVPVTTQRNRNGANADKRVPFEHVMLWEKPA